MDMRGEYKIWMYKRYLTPSYMFAVAVAMIPDTAIRKMQAIALRQSKTWLNLPRLFTASALDHPGLIDIPTLSELKTEAKLTFLTSVISSNDRATAQQIERGSFLSVCG